MQEGPITDPVSPRGVGCIEDSPDLLGAQMAHRLDVDLDRGDGQHATNLLERSGTAMLHEPHERLDGRQPSVTATPGVAAGLLEMSEKGQDERRIEVLEVEVGRGDLQPVRREGEEKLERVGIAVDGVRTHTPIDGEALSEPGGDMRRDGDHGAPPRSRASQASAMSVIS